MSATRIGPCWRGRRRAHARLGRRHPRPGGRRVPRGLHPSRSQRHRPCRGDPGQASVELALVLPLVLILLLVLVQVGLVVRDQILVVHAAREAAREAAVEPSPDAARQAAAGSSGLDPGRLDVEITGRGGAGSRVRAVARYRSPVAVPLLRSALSEITLQAAATMRVER